MKKESRVLRESPYHEVETFVCEGCGNQVEVDTYEVGPNGALRSQTHGEWCKCEEVSNG